MSEVFVLSRVDHKYVINFCLSQLSPFFRFGLHLFVSVTDIIFVCRIRDDKTAEDATNAEQIAEMYRNQDVVKNQQNGNGKTTSVEDDFDF